MSDLTSLNSEYLNESYQLIKESLQIEETYFNTFVASVVYFLKDDQKQSLAYAEKAFNDFPHVQRIYRGGTRDEMLREMISSIKANNVTNDKTDSF